MNNVILLCSIIMLVLLFLKVPVFISVLGASALYFLLNPNVNAVVFAQQAITGVESLSLLAIPFFVCAGIFMNYTGVTGRIMSFCEILTGRMNGGLAQVNILLSTLMGGLSGSNLADAAMQSKMLVPQMEKKGFSKEFSTVVTATSSMITPLIPPGIAMIIYGSIANVSIGKLFVAGIGIGTLLCGSLMIMVSVISKKRGYLPIRTEKIKKVEALSTLKAAALPLCLPIIIIGGIRLGIFTATEAGSIAVIYALLLGAFYKELRLNDIVTGLRETVNTTASIMLIVSAASVFSWILTKERIPQQLTEWIVTAIDNKFIFLIIVNVFLLVVGMFIEGNASMIVLVPLLAPVAAAYGINEFQFAMIYIFNNAIGAISPPMGTLMFVTCGITKCKTKDFIKEALPFYALLLINLLIITYVPFVSTILIDIFY
ncbi:C4-dicarboxylate ABC transporter [Candidatus Epulonipiscium fishelsonii]|uniref:C4-dicarboxylate ABC transporter n=1 Tax=Candidatus Epulonipiscium fishelsonii TaxID=77094 RepID=A0ACC8XCZ0_9FIRM|nr:C4-dicarboxylate ABC transporter [Epulopiscium sp. SCG-B11WGA-EpuloA1]ONI43192.1 C4-dicarboxylate ABC transporter [Epulopiscium sp. SCG-B05WGA-EpuloA1]ONI46786.1 C4-dicarboxylate ABC transporter [Epulopiscium sp. SCG-C06WGA-EpuloA1]